MRVADRRTDRLADSMSHFTVTKEMHLTATDLTLISNCNCFKIHTELFEQHDIIQIDQPTDRHIEARNAD